MINLKKFKQSILQKAMQGKLTKQLPSDGDAKDLLVKIANRKRNLVQDGKLKGYSRPLPPVTDKERPPFKIPDNWEWTRLGNIGSWKSGSTPKRSNKSYYLGNIPWVKVQDLHNRYVEYTSEHISKKALIKCPLRLNPIGSILIAMYCGQAIGKLGITAQNMATNQAICACVPYVVNNKFIFYYLMSQRNNLISMGAGGAQSNISRTKIIHYLIPLPPLSEQKRIVNKVHKCFELANTIQKERELNKKFAHDMKQSLLMEAMQGKLTKQIPSDGTTDELLQKIQQKKQALIKAGKIRRHKKLPPISKDEIPSNFSIPKNWKWVRLPDISTFPDQNQIRPKDISDNTWVLDLKEISKNTGIIKSHIQNKYKNVRSNKNIFHKNDVLYGKLRPYLNKVVVADRNGVSTTEIFVIHLIYKVNPKYIALALRSPIFLNKVNQDTYGTKMPRAGTRKFERYIIPLPPSLEQERIVNTLQRLFIQL